MVKKATPPPSKAKKPSPPPAPPPFRSPALVAAREEAEKHIGDLYGGEPLYVSSPPFPRSAADKKAEREIKFEAIQRDISSLTALQRDEIRKTILSLTKKKVPEVQHPDHELMHQAFMACMREKRYPFPSYVTFYKGKAGKLYSENIKVVTKYIDTTFSGITKPERLKLMMLMSRCIMGYIEDQASTVEGTNAAPLLLDSFGFAICCAKVQALVERSFPGYAEAGMIGMLLKSYQ